MLTICLGVLLVGCGRSTPPWGTAQGQVTIDGQPVTDGCVVFENKELAVSRLAPLDGEGRFSEKSLGYAGLPVGRYRVAVTPQLISKGDFVPVIREKPGERHASATAIPKKYHDPSTSELTAEVKEGRNPPFIFTLQSERDGHDAIGDATH